MQQSGFIVKRPFAVGSKSERQGIFLVADGGHEFVLRRQGGNPFFDSELEKLVGQKVVCQGSVIGDYTFLASDLKIV
jgi:hypothetical protein